MAFNLICETTGPAVRTPIGVMGDETTQGECRAVPRYDEHGDITTALTAADYAILPFSYVVQSLPTKDEFSEPSWNQNFVGNVPTIFGNFYRRSFDPDTCALGPAGLSQDGIDDPEAAQEDPIAAARTAILLHGTSSMLTDDRFFRHAFLGMYVELIPTDSGLRPEGYSQYGPPLMRPVLAEHIRGTVFYNSSAPSMALVAAGYEYLGDDGSTASWTSTASGDVIAVMAEIWQLCKIPSLPTIPKEYGAGNILEEGPTKINIEKVYDRMSVRINRVCRAIGTMSPHIAAVYEGPTWLKPNYLNPWALRKDEYDREHNANEFLLGSPLCPSFLVHMLRFQRSKVSYLIPETDMVYEHCIATTPPDAQIARWGAVGESVDFCGIPYVQFPMKEIKDLSTFTAHLTKCGNVTLAGVTVKITLGIDLKTRATILKHITSGLTEEDTLSAFGDMKDLPDEDVRVLKDVSDRLHRGATLPLIAMNMSHYFKEHAFFLDHPFLGEHLRTSITKSDQTRVNVATSTGQVSITVEAALGSATMHSWSKTGVAEPYKFSKYTLSTPPISHPIIDNLMELMPTRKRQRDLDLYNDRKLHEESLEKVLSELDKRPVRAKWIIGEFITVESRNTIRICLRKPFVYM